MQLVGGVLLGLAAIAASSSRSWSDCGGSDDETTAGRNGGPTRRRGQAADAGDLRPRRGREGRRLHAHQPEYEGAGHEEKDFTRGLQDQPADLRRRTSPSGTTTASTRRTRVPNLGMLVHTLEHGRINVQYTKGTPAADVAKLEALVQEQNEGYHMLLYENTTKWTRRSRPPRGRSRSPAPR